MFMQPDLQTGRGRRLFTKHKNQAGRNANIAELITKSAIDQIVCLDRANQDFFFPGKFNPASNKAAPPKLEGSI